jgi:hypothetical protein
LSVIGIYRQLTQAFRLAEYPGEPAHFSPNPEWAEIAKFQQPSHSDMIPA